MGVSVLILGHSGSGKSTSLRNFEPGEIGIFNVAPKPLPFRKKLDMLNHAQYNQIHSSLTANKLRAYVVDDTNYLMSLTMNRKYDLVFDFCSPEQAGARVLEILQGGAPGGDAP